MRSQFLIDPSVTFLNHGSFGACPIPVFERYRYWQHQFEWEPIQFILKTATPALDDARAQLASYLHTDAANLFFIPNASVGVNTVARSIKLEPGDEVLGTDHEYGSLVFLWEYLCEKAGAKYIKQPVALPVTTQEKFVEDFWKGVTPRTKVIFMSHITSPTALKFPIEEICRRAREAGIITIIDGAHGPSQVVDLNLDSIGADFYSGNCHKWLCAPKGSAFLYTRPERQSMLEPLIISWGWRERDNFAHLHQEWGTRDYASFLSVPDAIKFQQENNWPEVVERCHALARDTRERFANFFETEPIVPANDGWYVQMIAQPLPTDVDPEKLRNRLFDEFHIEIPMLICNDKNYIRAAFQGYNTREDADKLMDALHAIFKS